MNPYILYDISIGVMLQMWFMPYFILGAGNDRSKS
jgi:hypothetical protein